MGEDGPCPPKKPSASPGTRRQTLALGQEYGKCFLNKLIPIIPGVKSDLKLKRSPGDPKKGKQMN